MCSCGSTGWTRARCASSSRTRGAARGSRPADLSPSRTVPRPEYYGNPAGVTSDIEVVRAIYAAFARRDLEGALAWVAPDCVIDLRGTLDRKSTRLNSSHANISYAVFCLKKKKKKQKRVKQKKKKKKINKKKK